ncbi:MAG: hypothetical protein ACTSU2_01660 [Promethearchaeota archaeon]
MPGKKSIYVMCIQCKRRFRIVLDKDIKFDNEDNLYSIVHVHGEYGVDAHALIIEIDRNFNVRNTRVSDSLIVTFDL